MGKGFLVAGPALDVELVQVPEGSVGVWPLASSAFAWLFAGAWRQFGGITVVVAFLRVGDGAVVALEGLDNAELGEEERVGGAAAGDFVGGGDDSHRARECWRGHKRESLFWDHGWGVMEKVY